MIVIDVGDHPDTARLQAPYYAERGRGEAGKSLVSRGHELAKYGYPPLDAREHLLRGQFRRKVYNLDVMPDRVELSNRCKDPIASVGLQ